MSAGFLIGMTHKFNLLSAVVIFFTFIFQSLTIFILYQSRSRTFFTALLLKCLWFNKNRSHLIRRDIGEGLDNFFQLSNTRNSAMTNNNSYNFAQVTWNVNKNKSSVDSRSFDVTQKISKQTNFDDKNAKQSLIALLMTRFFDTAVISNVLKKVISWPSLFGNSIKIISFNFKRRHYNWFRYWFSG